MSAPFLVTKPTKSVGIAILLTFLFGPIGLFYASVSGGLIMTFTPILLLILAFVGLFQQNELLMSWSVGLLIIFAATFWLINIIWAVIGVNSYNKEIEDEARKTFELWTTHQHTSPNQFITNINQPSSDIETSGGKPIAVSAKPNIHDWLKSNPGKSMNDYYTKFGK